MGFLAFLMRCLLGIMNKIYIVIFLLFVPLLFSARDRHVSIEWNTESVNLGNGLVFAGDSWHFLPWFGFYYQTGDWWIYHLKEGWLYPESDGGEGVWFYSNNSQSWIWLREDVYPWAWSQKLNSWINLYEDYFLLKRA